MRTVTEIHRFRREEIEQVLKAAAKASVVGSIYYGEFKSQSVEWLPDGTAIVMTTHIPAR